MKITGVDVIKNGERDLMDAITADLDWGAVERIFRERHNLNLEEDIEYRKGDIVVHQEQVAYRLDFLAKVTLSVLLDRDGNYLSVEIAGAGAESADPGENHSGVEQGPLITTPEEGYEKVLSRLGQDDPGPGISEGEADPPDSAGKAAGGL